MDEGVVLIKICSGDFGALQPGLQSGATVRWRQTKLTFD